MRYARLLIAPVLCLCTWPAKTWAQPALEGSSVTLAVPAPAFSGYIEGKTVWRQQLSQAGAHFVRLEFSDIVDRTDAEYEIVVRDANFNAKFRYPKSEFGAARTFWTGLIPGDTLTVELVAQEHPPVGLTFTLSRFAFQAESPKVLSIYEGDDREPIKNIKTNANLYAAARSVAKLALIVDGRPAACTGFMISDDEMITNHHCVNTDAGCRNSVAVFGFEDTGSGLSLGEQHRCVKLEQANAPLDFAVLKIDGAPGRMDRWGHLSVSPREPSQNETLYLIGHPAGEPKQISRTKCLVKTAKIQGSTPELTDFGHTCDTLGGNSGSPVLAADLKVIGLHHLGFLQSSTIAENRAVQVRRIAEVWPPLLSNGNQPH